MIGKIKKRIRTLPRWAKNLSAILLVFALFVVGFAQSLGGSLAAPVGDVVFKYPQNPLAVPPAIQDVDWALRAEYPGYDTAYTEAVSAQYNGTAVPNHVVAQDGDVSFFGYNGGEYTDAVFSGTNFKSRGNAFILTPSNMNFHTFSESGYLFNGEMKVSSTKNSAEKYDIKYTGYALVLTVTRDESEEGDLNLNSTADLQLYYFENVLCNQSDVPSLPLSSDDIFAIDYTKRREEGTRTLISTIKTNIRNLDSTPFRVNTEINPDTRAFKVYVDGAIRANVSEDEVKGGKYGSQGFGFYTKYFWHACDVLTRINYEEVTVNIVPIEATATVNFIQQGTGTVIRAPETLMADIIYQKYWIEQPQTITYNGDKYYIISNSHNISSSNDIQLTYQTNAAQNVTNLYYLKADEMTALPPTKTARVNSGDWENGTETDPVLVREGSKIDYKITTTAPPLVRPMLSAGDGGSTNTYAWWRQPSGAAIPKNFVTSVTFVNLPKNYSTPAAFLADYPQWNGKAVLKVWDATETDTTANPDFDKAKVIAWAITNDTGRQDVFVGGYGGVWLTAKNVANNQFYNFNNMTSLNNMSYLHTDKAVRMDNMFYSCNYLQSVDVSNFDTSNVTTMDNMFYNCTRITSLDFSSFDTSKVTSMKRMFYNCGYLTSLDFSSFDTSNVTDMQEMFYECVALTSLDLSSFNTSKVTDMHEMFYNCLRLTSLDLSHFDTSSVTDMSGMFYYCSSLVSLDVSNFDTASVTTMEFMFYNCTSLTSLDVNSFDTSNVTTMAFVFASCRSLTSLDVSSFNTENVTTMEAMFSWCRSLTSLDVSNFDTGNVIDISCMFASCNALTSLDVSNFNTENVTTMEAMFEYCVGITSLDVRNFDTSRVTNMYRMFSNCKALTSLDVSSFNTENVINMEEMFGFCSALISLNLSNFDTGNVTNIDYMFRDCKKLSSLDLSNFNTANVSNMRMMFYECRALTSLDVSSFDTSKVTNMEGVFANCIGLTSLDLRNFNTENVTSVGDASFGIFAGCSSLTYLDVSSFDTSKVTSFTSMFNGCSSLTTAGLIGLENFDTRSAYSTKNMFKGCSSLESLDLSHFDTSQVGNMEYMFQACIALTSLNVSSFDTSQGYMMAGMFSGCSSLTSLDVSSFDTSRWYTMSGLFSGCRALTSLDVSNFNTETVSLMYSMFSGCSSLTSLDLSSFNTENVTNMSNMFSNCSGLTSLDLSTFDTARVTDMSYMFSGCTELTNLDLSTFKSDALTNMTQMFSGCTNLTDINLSGFVYTDKLNSAGKSDIFYNRNAALELKVRAANVQAMFAALSPTAPTITVVSSPGKAVIPAVVTPATPSVVQSSGTPVNWQLHHTTPTAPVQWVLGARSPVVPWMDNFRTPAPVSPIPVTPPSSGSSTQFTVVDIIPAGLSIDTSGITGTQSGTVIADQITWKISGQTITWSVPESMLPADLLVSVTVNTGQTEGTDYINVAEVTTTEGMIINTNSTYHRFTKNYQVTEQYFLYSSGPTTTKLNADLVTMVPPTGSYNVAGSTTTLAGFAYYGYQRVGIDSSVVVGNPPTPAYSNSTHSSDFAAAKAENIRLYYKSTMLTVTIHFVDEDGNAVKPAESMVVASGSDYYMPMSSFDSFNAGGKTYNYFDYAKNPNLSVKEDAIPPIAAVTPGNSPVRPDMSKATFGNVTASKDITLYFTTQKAVVVHFAEKINPSNILNNDETYFVSSTFNPTSAARSDGGALTTDLDLTGIVGKMFTYTSTYRVNGGTLQSGNPTTVSAPSAITLYFETMYEITEKVHDVDGKELSADNIFSNINGGQDFYTNNSSSAVIPDEIGNYVYVGYKIGVDKSELKYGKPSPVFTNVMSDQTVIYVYEKNVNTIHVRQIILDPQAKIEVPDMGYIKLIAGTKQLPITVKSGTGAGTAFTSYTISADYGDVINVLDVIPQYYKAVGYKANAGSAAVEHDQSHMTLGGNISIDFSSDGEWWVTIFITPTTGTLDDYQWGDITNDVGEVLKHGALIHDDYEW